MSEIFGAFDLLVEKHGVEKIKTIGDAYMAAGGIPTPQPDHAVAVAGLALDLQEEVERFNQRYDTSMRLRVGICTGPVIAGVIGRKRIAYDLWGEMHTAHAQGRTPSQAGRVAEMRQTRPLSVVMAEQVTGLRAWAAGRIVPCE